MNKKKLKENFQFSLNETKFVLARHYTNFSPEKLREVYSKANLEFD